MPYYLLVHKVEVFPESQDNWIAQWREIRKKAHGDIEWVHSFFDPTEGKLYCQWKAENMESIVKCLPPDMQKQAPIEYSSEIIPFDMLWLD
jgi:hypothetical protein